LFGDASVDWIQQPLLIMSDAPALGTPPPADRHNSPIARERFEARLDDESERRTKNGFARQGGYYLTIAGIEHLSFSDSGFTSLLSRPAGIGSLERYRAAKIISDYLVQFFDKILRGMPALLFQPGVSHDPAAKLTIWPRPR
jgi:hypothetical protein